MLKTLRIYISVQRRHAESAARFCEGREDEASSSAREFDSVDGEAAQLVASSPS